MRLLTKQNTARIYQNDDLIDDLKSFKFSELKMNAIFICVKLKIKGNLDIL